MKILVACEYSGTVREAFRKLGHDAWSCDILPSDDNSEFHIQGDVLLQLDKDWDMMIAHPPCTHLAVSGARWFKDKVEEQKEAIDFFMKIVEAPIPRIAVENPVSIMSNRYRKPDQIIQPWMFGDEAQKSTCLWLKNLPLLVPTNIVGKGEFVITKGGKRFQRGTICLNQKQELRSEVKRFKVLLMQWLINGVFNMDLTELSDHELLEYYTLFVEVDHYDPFATPLEYVELYKKSVTKYQLGKEILLRMQIS